MRRYPPMGIRRAIGSLESLSSPEDASGAVNCKDHGTTPLANAGHEVVSAGSRVMRLEAMMQV